jgi:hypothetical protein
MACNVPPIAERRSWGANLTFWGRTQRRARERPVLPRRET